jgi:hypothetical protein
MFTVCHFTLPQASDFLGINSSELLQEVLEGAKSPSYKSLLVCVITFFFVSIWYSVRPYFVTLFTSKAGVGTVWLGHCMTVYLFPQNTVWKHRCPEWHFCCTTTEKFTSQKYHFLICLQLANARQHARANNNGLHYGESIIWTCNLAMSGWW